MEFHVSSLNFIKVQVTACKLMEMYAFWNILEHSACILKHFACILEHSACILKHSGTFWNILHAFFNILEHSGTVQTAHSERISTWNSDRHKDTQTLGLVELRLDQVDSEIKVGQSYMFRNKTKYFRLRLTDKVSSEGPNQP